MDDLANETQGSLGMDFHDAVEYGHPRPLVLRLWMLGTYIVPLLWLAISHSDRPWLHHTRWVVVAFVAMSSLKIIRHLKIEHPGLAYMTGIWLLWNTLTAANMLIFTRPQLEAARAIRAPGTPPKHEGVNGRAQSFTGSAQGASCKRRIQHSTPVTSPQEAGGDDRDETWIWQTFPAKEPFLTRLGWVFDLSCSVRGAGWNWAIPPIPQPLVPAQVKTGERVDVGSIPRKTGSGFKICVTLGEFVRTRLMTILVTYMVVDLASVCIAKDPYFTFGPGSGHELPAHLDSMPPWLLLAYREALLAVGIMSSLTFDLSVGDLLVHWLWGYVNPARSGVWQYASIFGSFSQVLDRGLAGWWGASWHQGIRLHVTAPALYLTRRGHLKKGSDVSKMVTLATAFTLSGLLHAAGSFATMAHSRPWKSFLFFVLQVVGIVAQESLTRAVKAILPKPSRALARGANLVFAMAFLYTTGCLFLDETALTGIWAREKHLISPLRGLGFGHPTDNWWRLDATRAPRSCWRKDC